MHAQALQTYGRAARAGLSGRALEAALFNQIALDLERCVASDPVDIDALVQAVERNRTFWALVGGDASGPDAPLPAQLKGELQSLCAWTMHQSVRALVDPRPGQVLPMARINRLLAEGLASRLDDSQAPVETAQLRSPVRA